MSLLDNLSSKPTDEDRENLERNGRYNRDDTGLKNAAIMYSSNDRKVAYY
jgi:hypothetical protein